MVDTVTDTTSCRSAYSKIENIHYLSVKENDNQYINTKD